MEQSTANKFFALQTFTAEAVAASLTVIGKEKLPFEQQFGSSVASALLSLRKRKGIRFVLGVKHSSGNVTICCGGTKR
jgi:hypothetical protein